MAQAVFEEHPLEQYLRAAGESREIMPGISHELGDEIDIDRDLYTLDDTDDTELCPKFILAALNAIRTVISSAQPSNPSSPFVERFKYNVISSSLLSSSLSTPHTTRTSHAQSIPGRLHHSRTSSVEVEKFDFHGSVPSSEPRYGFISACALATAMFFSAGYYILALIFFIAVSLLFYNFIVMTDTPSNDFTCTLESLDELVATYNVWESTVQDAIDVLEKEDHIALRSPSTPAASPSSSVRVALHTTLQATRTQCDNLRQLSSALTCPSELSQLSEMYAPPSPIKSPLSLVESSPRPFSLPSLPFQPTTPENKRSTWNGPYSSLAFAGSPTNRPFRRRDKHRSNLSTLFQSPSSSQSTSAPVTPVPASPGMSLAKVVEDGTSEDNVISFSIPQESSPFGPAALDLQRKRRTGGMEAFKIPPESFFSSELRSPRMNRMSATISSSSRFTTIQTPRHPLSLSALHHTLQGALASKRYTCSHLLALRFKEDEDEGYWENVRSIMDLLTSTFMDESSRLAEALEDLERQNIRDQNPTPNTSIEFENDADGQDNSRRPSYDRVTFAPMPSHLSRFAAHVAAITSALGDAHEHLEECVAALKEDPSGSPKAKSLYHSKSITRLSNDGEPEEPQALRAYERLRRELGLALRECERGRQKLVDIVHPPVLSSDEDSDDLPGFDHDASDESDKPDPISPSEDEDEPTRNDSNTVTSPEVASDPLDDATPHLLLSASIQHLPPPGIEQVFESDMGGDVPFTRERSKLSREERIKIMKADRESGLSGLNLTFDSQSNSKKQIGIEKWGPGGEVVQELKDVIWKVGERRRKMQDGHLQDS